MMNSKQTALGMDPAPALFARVKSASTHRPFEADRSMNSEDRGYSAYFDRP